MMESRVPKLLMGSSSEGLETAEALMQILSPDIEVQLWNDGVFLAGEYTLESLEKQSRAFDGAIILGTSDDLVISRGAVSDSLRDNLLLEYGMFVAMFGRKRALLALEGLGETKIPSDIYGVTCVGFSRSDPPESGLEKAAQQIRRVAQSFSLDVVDPHAAFRIEAILRAFLSDLQEALGGITAQVGFHVWVVDERVTPPRLVRVARSRTSPKAQLAKEFVCGEGVTGECWRTAQAVYVDLSELPYRTIDETSWRDYGPTARKGMDFQLLEQSRSRYRVVGATPLISEISSGTRFLGCLSYNVGPNVDSLHFNPDMLAVEKVLDRASEVIRIILEAQ